MKLLLLHPRRLRLSQRCLQKPQRVLGLCFHTHGAAALSNHRQWLGSQNDPWKYPQHHVPTNGCVSSRNFWECVPENNPWKYKQHHVWKPCHWVCEPRKLLRMWAWTSLLHHVVFCYHFYCFKLVSSITFSFLFSSVHCFLLSCYCFINHNPLTTNNRPLRSH